jgi:mannose-6-phosphate isomerase-like protein (cupin superfamily)
VADSSPSGDSWKVVDLSAVPNLWNVGSDGVAIDEDEAVRMVGERDPGIVERWADVERRYPGYDEQVDYLSVRQYLGISAFGAAAWTAPAGQCLVPRHSEEAAGYDQEELYIMIDGSARFIFEGRETVVTPGQLVYVAPSVVREAVALESPSTVLIIGGIPGQTYSPPPFAPDS